jgi:hypothetical protein
LAPTHQQKPSGDLRPAWRVVDDGEHETKSRARATPANVAPSISIQDRERKLGYLKTRAESSHSPIAGCAGRMFGDNRFQATSA